MKNFSNMFQEKKRFSYNVSDILLFFPTSCLTQFLEKSISQMSTFGHGGNCRLAQASLTESFSLAVDQSTEWLQNYKQWCMRVMISFSLFRGKREKKHFNCSVNCGDKWQLSPNKPKKTTSYTDFCCTICLPCVLPMHDHDAGVVIG